MFAGKDAINVPELLLDLSKVTTDPPFQRG